MFNMELLENIPVIGLKEQVLKWQACCVFMIYNQYFYVTNSFTIMIISAAEEIEEMMYVNR